MYRWVFSALQELKWDAGLGLSRPPAAVGLGPAGAPGLRGAVDQVPGIGADPALEHLDALGDHGPEVTAVDEPLDRGRLDDAADRCGQHGRHQALGGQVEADAEELGDGPEALELDAAEHAGEHA